jgi:hypothetical protein
MNFASCYVRAAAYSAAILAVSAVSAAATPGLVNTTVNLREGPATTTAVLTKIPGGSTVDVAGCSGEWCKVAFAGKSGYVIATALGQGGPPPGGPGGPPPGGPPPGYAPPPGYVPPPGYYGPPAYYGYGPYYYGPGPYYGWGGGWRGGWGGRRW